MSRLLDADSGDSGEIPSKTWAERRAKSRQYLESKEKHYLILGLVTLDVAAVLTDIMVSLVACDMGTEDEPWVDKVNHVTKICSLVFSCLFLVELVLTVWAFGVE